MKLNGTDNIITDLDVTVTGNKHLGDSLRTVVDNMEERVQSLEEQNKWLYANGGVGSGGGGGGSSTKWQIKANLDGMDITDNGTISLTRGQGNYDLKLYTSGGSGTYSVTYTYGNNISRTLSLSADNGWSASVSIRITENGRISINASDGNIRRTISGCSYIVTPYAFNNPALFKNNGDAYPSGNSDIFVDNAKVDGIIIKSDYLIAIERESDLSDFQYSWIIDGITEVEQTVVPGSSGTLSYEFPASFIVDENAALHSYQLRIYAKPKGQLEPIITTLSGSFNLIPNGLYLKISPNEGETIYDNTSILDPYTFSTNKSIGLFVRIYNGPNASGKYGNINWDIYYVDGSQGPHSTIPVTDGITYNINLSFSKPGWNRVHFTYDIDGEAGEAVDKYFHCAESTSNYNWFIDNHGPAQRRWYIAQANSEETKVSGISGIDTINTPLYIQKKSADINPTEFTIDGYVSNDQLINIGIQYNDINNTQNPILRLYSDPEKQENAITIYQNKVVFGQRFFDSDQKCDIFLHKETEYDPEDRDKYHIISINIASCYYDTTSNNNYYECSVYIDGVLEGTVNAKPYRSPELYKLDLLPGNYSINHIDIARFDVSGGNKLIYDTDVNWYWNSYRERIAHPVSEAESSILEALFNPNDRNNPTYSIVNELIKVNSALPNNVALNAKVPVMVLTCERDIIYQGEPKTIYEWMNTGYTDGEKNLNTVAIDIKSMQWSQGKSELKPIEIPVNDYFGHSTHFILKLQGSSTMSNKSKNYTLDIAQDESIVAQNQTVLFSPNYVSGNADTFLPERAFTLKADVVDSSHSNNTAVGKFVNENNNWQYREMQHQQNVDPEISTHIKQCLEGFSMLLFMNVTYNEGGTDHMDTYYLGIYNFNLGRDSYFNLGYCDLSQLDPEELTAATTNGFTFCKVGGEKDGIIQKGITPLDGFLAAEVQDNSPYWDFSQYDTTILFPLNADETYGYMFGDIVDSTNTAIFTEGSIQNLVRSIAAAGGYLFNTIGKELVPCKDTENNKQITYHIPNKVSDYRVQYKRGWDGTNPTYTPYPGDLGNLDEGALTSCILDNEDTGAIAKLDYESVVYYYTTCMALGLVDSVQKNLNIKTWSAADGGNGTKSGVFFYDMDTCLGKTNAGGKTSYFSFSDFWKSKITRYDASGNIIPPEDTTTEVARTVNDGIENYRDCFLWDSKVTGYDTPSSYLFAIAKYAVISNTVKQAYSETYPQNIYAKWRGLGGALETADKFIDKYFASNLDDIPECLINLNYRNKYLYDYASHSTSFPQISESLHGRGIEETRDWLRGRLHILDAYFNLRKAEIYIYGNVKEPAPVADVSRNKDVYILSDIFSNNNETVGRKTPLNFVVNAADYSPLCVRVGNGYLWYLFEDSTVNYETNVPISGVQATIFGGSQLWRSLNSIDSFITSRDQTGAAFVFNTDTIDTLVGTTGTQTGNWSINAPALKTIQLTSPNYTGELSINSSFESLSDINISNSGISLIMRNAVVKNVQASNLRNSGTINIENCLQLENVNLSNSLINTCSIIPAWTDNLNFTNVRVKQLTLKAPSSNGNLTINDNSIINNITFSNMKDININRCASLQSVSCSDLDTDSILENVTITSCTALSSLTIKSSNLRTINLSGCSKLEEMTIIGHNFDNLKFLNLSGTSLKKIIFKNDLTGAIKVNDSTWGSDLELGRFDFSGFRNLATSDDVNVSYVALGKNPNLKSVQFLHSNITRLFYSFSGCDVLERVYGQFSIKCTACFQNCYIFSIHGSNLNGATWQGRNIRESNGYINHPTQLYSGDVRNHSITGKGITKMWFGISDGTSTFYATSCTIFDVYYILEMCDKDVNVINLNYIFYSNRNSTYGRFNWYINNGQEIDNSPYYKMFEHCTHLQSATYFAPGSGTIRFKSPSHSGEEITADDGLFSPLTSLQSIDWWFSGYNIAIDRFCWRRKNGNYAITTFNDFRPKYIVGDVNNIALNNITSTDILNAGNLTGFFDNLPDISGTVNGLFGNTYFVDLSTITNIPNNITTIRASFVSEYGTGTIAFDRMFNASTKLNYLYHSFRVDKVAPSKSAPIINLTNNTFSRFAPRSGYTGLIDIGYDTSNGNYRVSGPLQASLSGEAIIKRLPSGGQFPFNIFKNLTNLRMAIGVFRNASAEDISSYNGLQLPGSLFNSNTKLEDCSAEFYDLQVDYSISKTHKIKYNDSTSNPYTIVPDSSTSINFINCPKLNKVSYLFGGHSGQYMPHLTGFIPKNLFWHGATVDMVQITGADTYVEDKEHRRTYDEHTIDVYKIKPTLGITNMEYCFSHCNCSAYEHLTNSEEGYDYESNPDYSPFEYIKQGDDFFPNTNKNTHRYTAIWSYDGRTSYSTFINNEYEMLDFVDWNARLEDMSVKYQSSTSTWLEVGDTSHDVQPAVFDRFMCSPDLLRFCNNNCDVSFLFYESGLTGMNSHWHIPSETPINNNKYAYGILGRICPYLLKPVYDTKDVSGMFGSCKCLSYVTDLETNKDYMIPEKFFTYAKGVNKLQYFFEHSVQPHKVALTEVFKPLTGHEIDVQYIFDLCYWCGSEEDPTVLNEVFGQNAIKALTGAFRGNTSISSTTAYPYNQYVTFANIFQQNKYNTGTYVQNASFSYCFYGYGNNTDLSHEHSLSTDQNSYNYTRTQ